MIPALLGALLTTLFLKGALSLRDLVIIAIAGLLAEMLFRWKGR